MNHYGNGSPTYGNSELDADGWPIKVEPPKVDWAVDIPVEKDPAGAIHRELKRVRVESVRDNGKPGARGPRLPTREELAALALDVYRLALDHKRAYVNRQGDTRMVETPDFRAACEALSVAAKVAGLSTSSIKAAEAAERAAAEAAAEELDAEAALDRLRSNIAREVASPIGPAGSPPPPRFKPVELPEDQ